MNEELCVHEGCTKPVKVKKRGLCHNHYLAFSLKYRPRKGHSPCAVDECEFTVYAKGFCRSHYDKNKRHGQPEAPAKGNCECGLPVVARGMCKKHYANWYYYNIDTVHGTGAVGINRKEVPGYSAAHARVRTARGHAAEHDCVDCGLTASDWSLKADAEDVIYGPIGSREKGTKYSLNADDYEPRCSDCHAAYDARTGNRNYKTGAYAKNGGDDA